LLAYTYRGKLRTGQEYPARKDAREMAKLVSGPISLSFTCKDFILTGDTYEREDGQGWEYRYTYKRTERGRVFVWDSIKYTLPPYKGVPETETQARDAVIRALSHPMSTVRSKFSKEMYWKEEGYTG
jgi:hypothetical protein